MFVKSLLCVLLYLCGFFLMQCFREFLSSLSRGFLDLFYGCLYDYMLFMCPMSFYNLNLGPLGSSLDQYDTFFLDGKVS